MQLLKYLQMLPCVAKLFFDYSDKRHLTKSIWKKTQAQNLNIYDGSYREGLPKKEVSGRCIITR